MLHALGACDVMRGGEDVHGGLVVDHVTGERMQRGDAVDLVAEELDADSQLLIYRDDLDGVATHAERAARERDVVALVLHVDELAKQLIAVNLLAFLEEQHAAGVLLRRTEAVDARNGGDDHAVTPREQVRGGLMAQPLHIVVDVGVLLDVRVGLRYIRLGLVVVVVADEVADRVVGHEFAEFGA